MNRQLVEQKPTFSYLLELLQESMMGLIRGADGKRKIKLWLENKTAVATHDSSIILDGTFTTLKKTSLGRVYSDYTVNYNYSPSTGAYKDSVRITKTDQSSFPASNTYETENTNITFNTIEFYGVSLNGQIVLKLPDSTVINKGDVFTFSDSGSPLRDFNDNEVLSVQDAPDDSEKWVYLKTRTTSIPTDLTVSPGAGRQLDHKKGGKTWKTYAQGFSDTYYATAKQIWENLHDAYLRTKKITPLPGKLANLNWIHSEQYNHTDDEWNIPTTLANYLLLLSQWTSYAKDIAVYEIPLTSTTATLELLDPVNVNDAKLTDGSNRLGWIVDMSYNTRKDIIKLEVLLDLDPNDPITARTLIDEGEGSRSAFADQLDEGSGSQSPWPDQVDENA
jgi:hypothetical protein